MKTSISFVLTCSLVAATSLSPAYAGEPMDPSDKASLYATLALSTPLFLSASVVSSAVDASSRADHEPRAGALPAMKVTAVRTAADGGREVDLMAHHDGKDEVSTLRWPRRDDDPAATFQVGQTVAFIPSSEGSGWMLQDDSGADLAFVPTALAAAQADSQGW